MCHHRGFFAFMLSKMLKVDWLFAVWLLVIGLFLLFPRLLEHPFLVRLFHGKESMAGMKDPVPKKDGASDGRNH